MLTGMALNFQISGNDNGISKIAPAFGLFQSAALMPAILDELPPRVRAAIESSSSIQ
jgi:hypothetical protein